MTIDNQFVWGANSGWANNIHYCLKLFCQLDPSIDWYWNINNSSSIWWLNNYEICSNYTAFKLSDSL